MDLKEEMYYRKYLKYKQKYLRLCNEMNGGTTGADIHRVFKEKKFDKEDLNPTKDDKLLIKKYLLKDIKGLHNINSMAKTPISEIDREYKENYEGINLDDYILYVYSIINTEKIEGKIKGKTFSDKIKNFDKKKEKWAFTYSQYTQL
jgi:hypothetical protein